MSRVTFSIAGLLWVWNTLAFAGPYGPGAPSKSDPPKAAGEYRIKGPDGKIKYLGETKDLQRRKKQHERSGRIAPGDTFEHKVANPEATTDERRAHEKEKIKKHNPPENKSKGGEGRK
jgi:hypothetical protein